MSDEPIAVVGMSCRFAPDNDTPEKFWSFLAEGRDAVGEVPAGRWSEFGDRDPATAAVLRRCTRFGSFLDDVAGFDAAFFGMSPREAESIDPQQRLLMEVMWEALEHAGIPPRSLKGSGTGVFVAANSHDYGDRLMSDLPRLEAWSLVGVYAYALANRTSCVLDVHGPSVAVDTACAGSLTALHSACQYLWRRETALALVGGVNVIAAPGLQLALDLSGATSPQGRSRSFDRAADGYGRGEGVGTVVLKRLGDARRDGDRVLALVRGGGVFHEGAGEGMMVPNAAAQERMLRAVYGRCGIDPATVDYVEAHATGTPVGDPIEAAALANVFGAGRPDGGRCLVGSVKPNIGHLEAGAGIAGVIKLVLALRHGQVPPSLHDVPTDRVDWDRSGLRVTSGLVPWPENGRPRRAGVSSFGVGGAIAHVVLEQAPPVSARPPSTRPGKPMAFPISSMSGQGVRENAGRLADWLDDHPDIDLASVGHTLALRRSHLDHRAAVVAADVSELARRLRAQVEPVRWGRSGGDPVWVFSGHGAQWPGMGRELLADEPVFADTIDSLSAVYRREIAISPREAIERGDWTDTRLVQAMTLAVQVGLAELWRSWGLRPGAVIGYSNGEISAAVVAGVLDRAEAARFACRRAVVVQRAAGQGSMVMAGMPFGDAAQRLAGRTDVVAAIAAAPSWTVLSGTTAAVRELTGRWGTEGVVVRKVNSDVPFHSPVLDPLIADVADAARGLCVRDPELPLYSTVLADPRTTAARDWRYWAAMLRDPVRFTDAVAAAAADGHRVFLEVSSHPIVTHSIDATLAHLGVADAATAFSLRRGRPEVETLLTNLGVLHSHGASVDWARLNRGGDLVDLPTTAWQHQPYWVAPHRDRTVFGGGHDPDSHTLLGPRVTVNGAEPVRMWQTHLDLDSRPYPGDHPVHGVEIVPAAVLIATLLDAAGTPGLTDVHLRLPVAVTAPRVVQVAAHQGGLWLSSRLPDGEDHTWVTHTTAVPAPAATTPLPVDVAALRARCSRAWSWDEADDLMRRRGVAGYGFAWRVRDLRCGEGELLAAVDAAEWASVLDAAFTLAALLTTDERIRMPARVRQIALAGPPPAHGLVHAVLADGEVRLHLLRPDGQVAAEVGGLRFEPLEGRPGSVTAPHRLVHELVHRPLSPADPAQVDTVAFLGDDAGRLARLREVGVTCLRVEDADEAAAAGADVVVLTAPESTSDCLAAAERDAWNLVRAVRHLTARARPPRLWCVTRAGELAHAPLHGLGRIIAGEHPELWGGLLDIATEPDGHRLLRLLRTGLGEDVITTADGTDLVARLAPVTRSPQHPPAAYRSDSTYLVTGGLGALGLETARWMVGRGARRLVLTGRTGLPPRRDWDTVTEPGTRRRIDAVRALENIGATVRTIALDIADHEQATAALAPESLGLPPVRGVVHAAGVAVDARVADLDRTVLAEVMRAKVHGTVTLHRVFPPGTLDFLVLFSSSGQLARLTGQAAYAAANSFLDAFAHRREDTVSLGWMTWRGLGMSESNTAGLAEANARGLGALSPTEAFTAWQHTERLGGSAFAVTRILPTHAPSAVLSEAQPTDDNTDLTDSPPFGSVDPDTLADDVRAQIAAELRLDPGDLDPDHPLSELGVDSVMTVVIRARLLRRYGVELPPTLMWEQPTVHTIAAELNRGLADRRPAATAD